MEKRFDEETVASVEAAFDDAERPIKSNVAEVLLTLSAQSANIISLKIEDGVLTLTIAARVVATSLREKPVDTPTSQFSHASPTDTELSLTPRGSAPVVEPAEPVVQTPTPVFAEQNQGVIRSLEVAGPQDGSSEDNRQPAASHGIVFEDLD